MPPCGLMPLLMGFLLAGFCVAGEPTPPAVHQSLELRLQPAWATLLAAIQASPAKQELREQLADRYAAAGYSALANFFRYKPGRDQVPAERNDLPLGSSRWSCPENPASTLDIRRAAERIEESILTARYDVARNATKEAMAAFGPACQLLAEWSRLALLDTIRGKARPAESEAAVRILITELEDQNVQPLGLVGPAGVYEFLSQYFCAVHDFTSCVSALDFAVARLEVVPLAEAKVLDVAGWKATLLKRRQAATRKLTTQR